MALNGATASAPQAVTVAIALLRLSLNVFVVYISFARLKKEDTIRVFTLHLMSACVVNDAIIAVNEALILGDQLGWISYDMSVKLLIYKIIALIQSVIMIENPLMCLFFVIVSSLPYTAPLFYAKHLASGKWTRYYAVIHIFSYTFCGSLISAPLLFSQRSRAVKIAMDVLSISESIICFTAIVFTLRAGLAVARYKSAAFTSRVNAQSRRRFIFFLIYCIPMNIISLPLTVDGVLTVLMRLYPDVSVLYTIALLTVKSQYIINDFRTAIIGTCTLLALTPYRVEVMKMMRCRRTPT